MGGVPAPRPREGPLRLREQISWIDEDDLPRLEEKSQGGAASLSFVSGGGGQILVGDYRRGFALVAGQIAAAALGLGAAMPIAWVPFLALGIYGAIDAWRRARALNRYLAAKRDEYDRNSPHPAAYRLLAAMSAVDPNAIREGAAFQRAMGAPPAPQLGPAPAPPPSPPHPLVERLQKVAALRDAGAVNDGEFRERKVELLEKYFSGIERDQLDDLLYELLPMLEGGALDREDVEFIKQLVGA